MKILFPQPDLISTLLGSADPDVRNQAVEIIRSLWEVEAIELAARIARGLNESPPWVSTAEQVWPGTDSAQLREDVLRRFALDCALHTLPALEIFGERPWDGFRGRLPDLSIVDRAVDMTLDAVRTGDVMGAGPGEESDEVQRQLDREISACRRWTRAAEQRHGPVQALRRALEAMRAVRHACTLKTEDAVFQTLRAAQRAAIDPLAEATWQRGWFVECLLGQHTNMDELIPASA